MTVRGELFYYAQGRLLPENLHEQAADYAAQSFYRYSAGLPVWQDFSPEQSARMRQSSTQRTTTPLKRSPAFWDAVFRAHNRDESYSRLKSIKFLGWNVMVHYTILEELALVEERIQEIAKTDRAVTAWINNINSASAWNWRDIANTSSRSFHSYGTAIDILPKSLNGLATYWLWTAESTPEWWAVPYEKRFHPPEPVIHAFEQYGFIWGGKWALYDTMHFEYRPEIFLLNNIPLAEYR
ncbi:hypothetical protein FACS1894172_21640 [Spirochaetia bacterium]|nr:hypothetical protein FACS1894172_21640 [Spirochaetia bacterium]